MVYQVETACLYFGISFVAVPGQKFVAVSFVTELEMEGRPSHPSGGRGRPPLHRITKKR